MTEQGEHRGTPGRTPAEPGSPGADAPSEDVPRLDEAQLKALEEELRRVRVEDLLLQSVASVINLTARRIGKEDERDLEQARIGIEAVRALVDLLPEDAAPQVRDALSQLQILYAQATEGRPADEAEDGGEAAPPKARDPGGSPPEPGRAAEPPPRLWTPPGSA